MAEPQNGTIKWIKDEARLMLVIITIVGSVFSSYFLLKGAVNQNTYEIGSIKEARANSGKIQSEFNKITTESINTLKLDVLELQIITNIK